MQWRDNIGFFDWNLIVFPVNLVETFSKKLFFHKGKHNATTACCDIWNVQKKCWADSTSLGFFIHVLQTLSFKVKQDNQGADCQQCQYILRNVADNLGLFCGSPWRCLARGQFTSSTLRCTAGSSWAAVMTRRTHLIKLLSSLCYTSMGRGIYLSTETRPVSSTVGNRKHWPLGLLHHRAINQASLWSLA